MVTFDGRAPGTPATVWSADPRLAALAAADRAARWPGRRGRGPSRRRDARRRRSARRARRRRPPRGGRRGHRRRRIAPGSTTLRPRTCAGFASTRSRVALDRAVARLPVRLLGHEDGAVREHRDRRHARTCATLLRPRSVPACSSPRGAATGTATTGSSARSAPSSRASSARSCSSTRSGCGTGRTPDEPLVPWPRLRALTLSDRSVVLKRRATAAHATQVRAAVGRAGGLRTAARRLPRHLRPRRRGVRGRRRAAGVGPARRRTSTRATRAGPTRGTSSRAGTRSASAR